MPSFSTPSEVAREALRQLAVRRIPPTPDNYRVLYHEIAGTVTDEGTFPEKFVRQLARQLPRDTAERLHLARQLDQALADGNPEAGRQALDAYLNSLKADEPPAWNELIGNLLRQWESRQLGWTLARKREALERVLSANDPATLFNRLQALVRSWTQSPADAGTPVDNAALAATASFTGSQLSASWATASTLGAFSPPGQDTVGELELKASADAREMIASLRALLVMALDTVVPALLAEQPQLAEDAARLAEAARLAGNAAALRTLGQQLKKFAWRLEMAAGDEAEIRAGVLQLLRLLLENIDEIVVDDQWLHGQIQVLREVVDRPASPRAIDDAERRLKEVIYKQSQLKHNLSEAQRNLKTMLAGFVDQLARFAETTGTYHDRIGRCAEKISAARDITEIGHLLDEVMRETRTIQEHAQRSRDELQAARLRAREAEARIAALQRELDESTRLIREDALTGALNRRGLDEMFAKETARATRRRTPLCVALLDIDNFKKLNDTFGHEAGDAALKHLVNLVRQNLRPEDTVARYGGEEFVILYPETTLEQADGALMRLQRELTRALFLANNQKIMVTFSGGVTEWLPGENAEQVLRRADGAMYQAKQTGKNKVVAVPAAPDQAGAPPR